jgi:hypothetical protein
MKSPFLKSVFAVLFALAVLPGFSGAAEGPGDPKPKKKKKARTHLSDAAKLARAERFVLETGRKDGGSTGVGGGGDAVVADGNVRLRDLIDRTGCEWIPGKEFAASLRRFPRVLESLERVHPALAYEIRLEIRMLSICLADAPLKPVDTRDREAVVMGGVDGRQTLAIRANEQVFIDRSLFRNLSDTDRAYTFLHEVMHRFIPMDLPRRNQSLRNFVAAVHENELHPMSVEKFALQSRANGVNVHAVTGSDFGLLGVLQNRRSTFGNKVEAFRRSGRCDPTLSFLPRSLRTDENLVAYRASYLGDRGFDRCAVNTEGSAGLAMASVFCAAPSAEIAAEADWFFSEQRREGFGAWLHRFAYYWGPLRKLSVLVNFDTEDVAAAARPTVAVARSCQRPIIDTMIRARIRTFTQDLSARELLAQYIDGVTDADGKLRNLIYESTHEFVLPSIVNSSEFKTETDLESFFAGTRIGAGNAEIAVEVFRLAPKRFVARTGAHYRFLASLGLADLWPTLLSNNKLSPYQVVELMLDSPVRVSDFTPALGGASACHTLERFWKNRDVEKSLRKKAKERHRQECRSRRSR